MEHSQAMHHKNRVDFHDECKRSSSMNKMKINQNNFDLEEKNRIKVLKIKLGDEFGCFKHKKYKQMRQSQKDQRIEDWTEYEEGRVNQLKSCIDERNFTHENVSENLRVNTNS